MAFNYYEEFEKKAAAMSEEDFSKASRQFAMIRMGPGRASQVITALSKYKAEVGTPSGEDALNALRAILQDNFAVFVAFIENYDT